MASPRSTADPRPATDRPADDQTMAQRRRRRHRRDRLLRRPGAGARVPAHDRSDHPGGRRSRPRRPRNRRLRAPTPTTATTAAARGRARLATLASRTCSGAAAAAAVRRGRRTRLRRSSPATRKYVVVYRGLAQGQFGRFGQWPAPATSRASGAYIAPYGLMSPAQQIAMRKHRFMHDHGVRRRGARGRSRWPPTPRAAQPARGHVRPPADRARTTTRRAGSSSRSSSTTAAWRTTAPRR